MNIRLLPIVNNTQLFTTSFHTRNLLTGGALKQRCIGGISFLPFDNVSDFRDLEEESGVRALRTFVCFIAVSSIRYGGLYLKSIAS